MRKPHRKADNIYRDVAQQAERRTCKAKVVGLSPTIPPIGTWCNGSTTDFDSVGGGSNPPVPVFPEGQGVGLESCPSRSVPEGASEALPPRQPREKAGQLFVLVAKH